MVFAIMRLHVLINCCIARDIKADVDVDDHKDES